MEEITSAEATYGIHAIDTALSAWYRQMNDLAARGADRRSDELLILDMRIRIVEGLRAKFETDLYGDQPPVAPEPSHRDHDEFNEDCDDCIERYGRAMIAATGRPY